MGYDYLHLSRLLKYISEVSITGKRIYREKTQLIIFWQLPRHDPKIKFKVQKEFITLLSCQLIFFPYCYYLNEKN